MTLRERMKRRITKTSFYVMVAGVGGGAGLAHYPLGLMTLILVSWGCISIAVILAMQWRTRCPVCDTILGAKGRAVLKDHPTMDNCPHCGVNFDQPVESVANPK